MCRHDKHKHGHAYCLSYNFELAENVKHFLEFFNFSLNSLPLQRKKQGSYPFSNKKLKDFQAPFPTFKESIQCKKESLETVSVLVLPRHEQIYPEGLSVFVPFRHWRIWVG